MKNLAILLSLFVSAQINSSAQQYFPLVDSNAVWTVGFSSIGGPPAPGDFTKIYFGADTLINQTSYTKTYAANYFNYQLTDNGYIGAIREAGKKWLYIDSPDAQERLLYDFDAQVNDTLTVFSYHGPELFNLDSVELRVVSIDSTLIESVYRKRIAVAPITLTLPEPDYWIEGIGSVRGILFSRNCWGADCGAHLECYKENQNILYHDINFPVACDDFFSTTFIYLQAHCISDSCIAVEWATATEINNEGFEVQRSENGIVFEQIGWVDGVGNSSNTQIYSMIDCNVERDSLYYYRLKQVDFDSTWELTYIVAAKVSDTDCNPAGINAPAGKSQPLTVKPNPISQRGKIMFENANHEHFKCVLFDITGKEIDSFETFENEIEITKGDINPGTYFIKLIDARGLTKEIGRLIFN